MAATTGQIRTAEILLHAGADIDATDVGGKTALMRAARHGHRELAALLVERGADPRYRKSTGRTPAEWVRLYSEHYKRSENRDVLLACAEYLESVGGVAVWARSAEFLPIKAKIRVIREHYGALLYS